MFLFFQQFHISQQFLHVGFVDPSPFAWKNLRLLARLVCTRCTLCSSNWWWLGAVHYVPREESLGTNCEWNDIWVFLKIMVVVHYKPSILGYPYFWKHPYICFKTCLICSSRLFVKEKKHGDWEDKNWDWKLVGWGLIGDYTTQLDRDFYQISQPVWECQKCW